MKGKLKDVREIWVDEGGDSYRAIYTIKIGDVVYVLDAFMKKSKKGAETPQRDSTASNNASRRRGSYMKKNRDETIVEGSGNVFADLGLSNPEEALAKVKLMRLIAKRIEALGLNQVGAAERIGMAQSDISNIIRGRGRTYSMDRLFEVFHKLGGKVAIEAQVDDMCERIPVFT